MEKAYDTRAWAHGRCIRWGERKCACTSVDAKIQIGFTLQVILPALRTNCLGEKRYCPCILINSQFPDKKYFLIMD